LKKRLVSHAKLRADGKQTIPFQSTRRHTTEAFQELNGTARSPRRAAEHTIWDDVVENIDDVFT
jgi:hypothetical protein